MTIRLNPLPKVIDEVMQTCRPAVTVAFKLGWDEEERARAMLDAGVRMVVLNTPATMGAAEGSFMIMTAGGSRNVTGSKEEVAGAIWSELL
jgi:phosphopantothenoylcysteine decarboxylase/phosphopantothenate--cysteine ligase